MTTTEPAVESPEAEAIDPTAHANVVLENALLRAGVDLESPQGKLVRDAWEGKEPDNAKIKEHWELVKPTTEPAATEPEPEPRIVGEGEQAGERASLTATSVVEPNPEDVNPRDAAMTAAREVIEPSKQGQGSGTRVDAIATGIHMLVDAANSGDGRVLVQDAPRA